MNALRAEALACRRGGRLVLSGVDLDVPPGTAVLIRGPNGVGKSTLLRALAGFVPLSGGDARLGDLSLSTDPHGFQEQLAYAGHLDAVKPALSVADNLRLWAELGGLGSGALADALAYFGLDAIAGRPAAECSAGQKRRLGLARLLVADRPLWLLDEPTVSLDADAAGLVAGMVRRHTGGGGIALIATHIELDLPDARTLTLAPATERGANAQDDAFLAGDWS